MMKKIVFILLIIVAGFFILLFIKGNKTNKELTISIDFKNEGENLKYLWQGHYDIDGAVYNPGTSKDSQELLKGIVKYWRVSVGRFEIRTTEQRINEKISENDREFFIGKTLEDARDQEFYNWIYIDRVLAEVEALGAKPLINFDSMPKSLARNKMKTYENQRNIEGAEIFPAYEWLDNIRNSPPENNEVYAEVIKHIIMHYTEGWANGYMRDYKYIEIGNEPQPNDKYRQGNSMFDGTEEEFIAMYEIIAKTVKNHFGDKIKIGGAAFINPDDYMLKFIENNARKNIPMDFVSFHIYTSPKNNPDEFLGAKNTKELKDKIKELTGRNVELFLDEWGATLDTIARKNPYLNFYSDIQYALFQGAVYSILQNSAIDMAFQTILIDHPALENNNPRSNLNMGIITSHSSKPKPVYYLYQVLKHFDNTPVKLATIEQNGVYGIVAKGEDELNILLVNNGNKDKSLNLRINNLSHELKVSKYQKFELTQETFDKGEGLKFLGGKKLETEIISDTLKSKSVNLLKFSNPKAMLTDTDCREVRADIEYRCPYHEINENDDILLSQYVKLFSAKVDGSARKNLILKAPKGWGIIQNSISPDHKRLLLTMEKNLCSKDWREKSGRLCSWGRNAVWLATHENNNSDNPEDDVWLLNNLANTYGFNADVHGWTSWQSNNHAFFNAVIRPEGQPVLGNKQEDNNAQAYQISFDSKDNIQIGLWGKENIYREDCLTGRLYPSYVQNRDSCTDGADVVFARRCYSEAPSFDSYAWWNTKKIDGSGGKCIEDTPPLYVPILRVFSVKVDAQCKPKTVFDINKPIKRPRADGIFRYLAKIVPEWGDMQPTISNDGKFAAFHTVKGYSDSNPEDNCGSFKYEGTGSPRVFFCKLNENSECIETKLLTEPEDFKVRQGQPFFYENEEGRFIIITEQDEKGSIKAVKVRIDRKPYERTVLFDGIGGYPLKL